MYLFSTISTIACLLAVNVQAQLPDSSIVQIVYTSDAHFGITRHSFRGAENVNAKVVNAAMIAAINTLPETTLPNDNGLNQGNKINQIDFVAQTGDIANRMEIPYQSAATSWQQFTEGYINGLTIKNKNNQPTPLFIAPGNHDASNAIGHYKQMRPLQDASSMAGIYNLVFQPAQPKTAATYNYRSDKINYSKNMAGAHFVFINIWPDSANRIWMEQDLAAVNSSTPVIIFAHDPPASDPWHFTNPLGTHGIDTVARFENLLPEMYKDAINNRQPTNEKEQAGFDAFLKRHPNIRAYFHGHSNWTEFYQYNSRDHSISLPAFRVDSPMKGRYSATDETRLAFEFIVIDMHNRRMTVRECLWNTQPDKPSNKVVWGSTVSITL